jgi:hypothetical protein
LFGHIDITLILLLDRGDRVFKVGIEVMLLKVSLEDRLLKVGIGDELGSFNNLDIGVELRRRLKLANILRGFEASGLCWVGDYLYLISSDLELGAGESGLAGGFPL